MWGIIFAARRNWLKTTIFETTFLELTRIDEGHIIWAILAFRPTHPLSLERDLPKMNLFNQTLKTALQTGWKVDSVSLKSGFGQTFE